MDDLELRNQEWLVSKGEAPTSREYQIRMINNLTKFIVSDNVEYRVRALALRNRWELLNL